MMTTDSMMTMLWLSMYTLISIVNTFNYFALCMMCPCDALQLGVALSVQDEGYIAQVFQVGYVFYGRL